jgi:hypothetical protein
LEGRALSRPIIFWDGAEILDYKNDVGMATVELSVADKKIKARFDTGIGAFLFPTAFAEKLNFTGEPRVIGRARSATGDMEIKQVQIKDVIKLGRHEFADAIIVYPASATSQTSVSKLSVSS